MREAGQIVLVRVPNTDLSKPKLRPALLLKELPSPYDDWLICLISTKLAQEVKGCDEVIAEKDSDFKNSGLKQTSLIRIARLAVVSSSLLPGAIGKISEKRLQDIKAKLYHWIFR